MLTFEPLALPKREDRLRIFSPVLDGEMDLCGDCLADLDAWVRFPLEDDSDAIDSTTGQPA
jgi:hypothetical protein